MKEIAIWWRMQTAKLRRFIFCLLEGVVLVSFLGLAVSIYGSLGKAQPLSVGIEPRLLLIAGGLLVFFQAFKIYRAKQYDPEVAWHLWDDWVGIEDERTKAAEYCLKYWRTPANSRSWEILKRESPDCKMIEDVLDTLEDVGLYVKAGTLSDELAHHYFGHALFIYWLSGGEEYVSDRHKKEPSTWTHIAPLFERSFALECWLSRKSWQDMKAHFEQKLEEYLTEEISPEVGK